MDKKRLWKSLLFCVPAAFFILFLGMPLFCIVQRTGSYFQTLAGDRSFLLALRHSLTVSTLSAALTLIFAFFLAYTIRRTRLPAKCKSLIAAITQLPMLLPTVTYGFAILYSFGKQGLLTRLFGGHSPEIYGMRGLVLGYILYTLPTAFVLLDNSICYIDQRFHIVSLLMGDRPLSRFWNTVLRPMLGTLGAAFVQSFFLCFTDFGIPMAIGGQYEVVSMRLYQYMLGALPDFEKGAAAALVMLLPTLASLLLLRWLRRFDCRYENLTVVSAPHRPLHDITFGILSFGILLSLCLIFAVIWVVPFVHSWPYAPVFSLEHIKALFTTPRLLQIYRNSLFTAGMTAIFGTIIAYFAALLRMRLQMPRIICLFLDGSAVLSSTVPGMVLGIGLMFAFSGTKLQYTFFILIACNIIHFFNTPYTMISQALSKLNNRWETAASLLGDRWTQTLIRVLLPNTRTTILEMCRYFFINSMVTISAVIFLAGTHTMVVTTRIKELQHFAQFDEIFALSLLILLTNLLAKYFIRLPAGKKRKRHPCQSKFSWAQKIPAAALLISLVCILLGSSSREKIIIYSNADEEAISVMTDVLNQHGFQGQYIIQCFGTSELGGRLLVEKQNIEADLITLSEYYLISAQEQGVCFLNPGFSPPLHPSGVSASAPLLGIESCIIVNQPALQQEGLPQPSCLRDLAKPQYAGKISVPSIHGSSTGWLLVQAVLDQYGEQEGAQILSGILQNAGPHLEMSGSEPLTKLIAGEVSISYGMRHQAEHSQSKGMPLDCLTLNASYTMTESLVVIDKGEGTKHLAADMALCLQKYARPLIAAQYPLALYPGEPNYTGAKRYPKILNTDLLTQHQEFFERCLPLKS